MASCGGAGEYEWVLEHVQSPSQAERSTRKAKTKTKAKTTKGKSSVRERVLTSVWGGHGYVARLEGPSSVVVKVIHLPDEETGSFGDLRKRASYFVEAAFYTRGARDALVEAGSGGVLYVPEAYGVWEPEGEIVLALEAVDAPGVARYMGDGDGVRILEALAAWHGVWWDSGDGSGGYEGSVDRAVRDLGVAQQGSYWYLDTRPDEWESMSGGNSLEGRLKAAAGAIDARMKASPFQTIIHGDAKPANMMLDGSSKSNPVIMVDFQYVGKGPPTRDVAYFVSRAANDRDEEHELLVAYHNALIKAIGKERANGYSFDRFETEYTLACADLVRFLFGWGMWGSESILLPRTRQLMDALDAGSLLSSPQDYVDAIANSPIFALQELSG